MGKVGDEIARPILRALEDASPNLRALADVPRKLRAKVRGNHTGVKGIDRYDANATHVDVSVRRFNPNENHRPEEFDRQLKEQIDTLENTTMADWILNRLDYLKDGRPSDSRAAQNAARELARHDTVEEIMMDNPDIDLATASQYADQWLDTQDATHRLDGYAGGDVTDISGVGDSGVNASLGVQWRTRAGDLDAAVIDFLQQNPGVEPNSVFMNVHFR